MFDQEREHWDYEMGVNSEQQNAYDQSRMETDLLGDWHQIQKLIADGKYVVVEWTTKYCISTDATLGEVPRICYVEDNYNDAKHTFDNMWESKEFQYANDDVYYEVLPRINKTPTPVIDECNDDIPF